MHNLRNRGTINVEMRIAVNRHPLCKQLYILLIYRYRYRPGILVIVLVLVLKDSLGTRP